MVELEHCQKAGNISLPALLNAVNIQNWYENRIEYFNDQWNEDIYVCGKKEQKSLRTHRTWPRAIFRIAGPERLVDCRALDLKFNCVWGQSCCHMWIQIDTAARAQKGNLPVGSSSSS